MEYQMPFNADNADGGNSYLLKSDDEWNGVSYELWPIENSFCNPSPNSSSPTTLLPPPGCLSVEPIISSFSRTRTSSIVSPSVSAWSDSIPTPPVTPQRNQRWYALTPGEISMKPPATPYCVVNEPMDVHVLERDLWVPREWHLPSFSSFANQETLPSELDKSATPEDDSQIAFLSHANDPSLSRHIFSDTTPSPMYQALCTYRCGWSHVPPWSTPQTIAPRATVQATMTNSPSTKIESSSPFKMEQFEESSICPESSPLPMPSPPIVPSQSLVDDFQFLADTSAKYTQPVLTRKLCERNNRRPQHRKALAGVTCKPRRATDDFVRDAVIPPNTFACNFPGCIDKSTGRQKRFKRQEHRKRHEITVHKTKGDKKYYCWVPGCTTGFNRTDNLKNHINSTHGKNNPAQRNRYVATLDAASEYYDPSWQGELTDDGYPLIEGVTRRQCWIPNCEKTYHLEEKLKAHLLQQHGKKSINSCDSHIAGTDENSDSPDSDWKNRATKASSVVKKM